MKTASSDPYTQIIEYIKIHPAIVATSLFVFSSFVGTIYSWNLLRSFDLNVFDYAEPSDFFLMSFKEPYTISLIFFMFSMVGGRLYYLHSKERKQTLQIKIIRITAMLVFIVIMALGGGDITANRIKANNAPKFNVKINPNDILHDLSLIGSVNRFMFFYENKHQKTYVLPISSILSINR